MYAPSDWRPHSDRLDLSLLCVARFILLEAAFGDQLGEIYP